MNRAKKLLNLLEVNSLSLISRIHNYETVIRDLQTALSNSKTAEKTKYLQERIKLIKIKLDALKKEQSLLKPNNQAMGGGASAGGSMGGSHSGSSCSPGAQGNVNQLGALPIGPLIKKRKWKKNGNK
jgi:hypothetical protein